MALSNPVGLANLLSTAGATNVNVPAGAGTITVQTDDLIKVSGSIINNAAIGAVTVTGLGVSGNWDIEEEVAITSGSFTERGFVATARIPSGTTGQVNVAVASGTPVRWNITVEQHQGDNPPVVVQSEVSSPGSGTTAQVTLPASPAASSLVSASLLVLETAADTVEPDPDFTEGYDSTSGGSGAQGRVHTQYRNGGADAVVDASGIQTGANKIFVALEIAEESGGATVSPTPVVLTLVVPAPSLTQGTVTLSPSPVVATLAVPAPSVQRGTVTLAPSPVVMTLAVPAPTLTQGGVLTPSPLVMSLTIPAPSVAAGAVTLAPSPVVATLAVPAPTVARGAVSVAPSPVVLRLEAPAPSLTQGTVTLTPSPVTLQLVVPAPSVLRSALAPQPVVMTLFVPAPTVLEVVLIQITVELELQLARLLERDLGIARNLTFDLEI